ncbi:MAG: quercetin dioxygenase-like cupin family protein [Rhodothermales bacterium]|jgi:quercetin dioxygenase-like cupin family protein
MGTNITRTVIAHDDTLTLVRVSFAAGAVGSRHHHPQTQASYVVSGTWVVTIGDDEMTLKPGDHFFVPSDVEHGATSPDGGTLITTFAPGRAELL